MPRLTGLKEFRAKVRSLKLGNGALVVSETLFCSVPL